VQTNTCTVLICTQTLDDRRRSGLRVSAFGTEGRSPYDPSKLRKSPKAESTRQRRAEPNKLLILVRAEIKRIADRTQAPMMQAYMKSEMPYHGVKTPGVERVCKTLFQSLEFPDKRSWRESALSLWRKAEFREERYAAIRLTGMRKFDSFQTLDSLAMYEEMVVTGAWWDFVDEIAARRLGPLLRRYRDKMRREMLAWSTSENLWKRRSAILCQLTFKGDTDLKLLYAVIEPAMDSKEFFLRKAIGWALRQYAWTNRREVQRFVKSKQDRLSPLSQREALKNVDCNVAAAARLRNRVVGRSGSSPNRCSRRARVIS
jgi:3-methyladenine DNA glycosylase AlkD